MADVPELVRAIATALADDPDEVEVSEVQQGGTHIVQLKVSQRDMGRVIGRDGRVANAVRALIDAAPGKERWRLDILDD